MYLGKCLLIYGEYMYILPPIWLFKHTQKGHYIVVSNKRTLVYRIEVQACLLILKRNSTLQSYFGLHVYYFEEIFPLQIYALELLVFGIN